MSPDLETIFRDSLELPESDRATLAGLLIKSLRTIPDTVDELWSVVAERRWQEIESGAVRLSLGNRFARDCSVGDDVDQVSSGTDEELAEATAWRQQDACY